MLENGTLSRIVIVNTYFSEVDPPDQEYFRIALEKLIAVIYGSDSTLRVKVMAHAVNQDPKENKLEIKALLHPVMRYALQLALFTLFDAKIAVRHLVGGPSSTSIRQLEQVDDIVTELQDIFETLDQESDA